MAHGRKVGYTRRTDDKWQALLLIFHNNRRDQQLPWWSNTRANYSLPSRRGLPVPAPLWGLESKHPWVLSSPGWYRRSYTRQPGSSEMCYELILNLWIKINHVTSLQIWCCQSKQNRHGWWREWAEDQRHEGEEEEEVEKFSSKSSHWGQWSWLASPQAGPLLHPFILAMERQNKTSACCLWDNQKFQLLKLGIMVVFFFFSPACSLEAIHF